MQSLAEQIVCNIIKTQTALGDERVWVRNQTRLIPDDEGLFVVVGMVDSTVYSATSTVATEMRGAPPAPVTVEYQRAQVRENIQIDVFSRNNDALNQRMQIIHALRSINSQQVQEVNSFKISRLPTGFVNSSSAEGGSNLNRFSIIIPCLTWHTNEIVLADNSQKYYDDFTTRVDDEKTIGEAHGIIEFEIKAEDE